MKRSTDPRIQASALWTAVLFTWTLLIPAFPTSVQAQPRSGDTRSRVYRFDTAVSPDVSSVAHVQMTEFFNAILEVSDRVHVLEEEDLIIAIDRKEIATIVKNSDLDQADQLVFKGKDAIQDRRYKRAIKSLQKAIKLYESNFVDLVDYDKLVDAWMQMGIASWRGKYKADARDALERVISMRPRTEVDPKKHKNEPEFLALLKEVRKKQGTFEPGSIRVASTPSAGTVFVDGILSGRTPTVLSNLRKGSHFIQVKREGFMPFGKMETTPSMGAEKSISATLVQDAQQDMSDVEGEFIDPEPLMSYVDSGNFGSNFRRAAQYFCSKAFVNFLIYTYISRSKEGYGMHVFLYDASKGAIAELEPVVVKHDLLNLQVGLLELAQRLEQSMTNFPVSRTVRKVPPTVFTVGYEKMLAGETPESARKKEAPPPPPPPPAPAITLPAPAPEPARVENRPAPAPVAAVEPEASDSLDDLFGSSSESSESSSLFGTSSNGPSSTASQASSNEEFYETWWFWTAVGVGVVGTGLGTAFALGAFDGEEIPTFSGTVVFP